ncbi:ABC transporter permease [Devosia sp. A8/3-2]|nr:ABC transporter permease [Devosia sp. A8/3-2]
MIRFLISRILSAIPILLVLSLVTFAIIRGASGRLWRLYPVHGHQSGRRFLRGGQGSGRCLSRCQWPVRSPARAICQLDLGHHHPLRFRPLALFQQARWRRRRRAPACHHPARTDLPYPGLGHRHHHGHRGRHPPIFPGRYPVRFRLVPRHDHPAVPPRHRHHVFPGLPHGRAGCGQFLFALLRRRPRSWDKFVDLVKHVWPVIAIATFGGLAYNMRVMRANLLDVLNAQYVETARAKGLSHGAVIMKHAVPNALHPLVAYQGVVLPYMLTGEIEVAIVFGLATVGPAITGSMAVGDVWVTATFMLVLATTLIIGNIISDMMLAVLDPRIRLGDA